MELNRSCTENELGRLILRLSNTIIKNRNRHLAALNLTASQADSLRFFLTHEGATATDLKVHMGITHQTARGLVSRLVNKGLVELRRSQTDARCQRVYPSEEGLQLGRRMRSNRERTGASLLAGMSEEEQQIFLRLMRQALQNIACDWDGEQRQ